MSPRTTRQHYQYLASIIIKSPTLLSLCAPPFHFAPLSMHGSPNLIVPHEHEREYTDTYMSDSMIQAQLEVDNLPHPEGDIKEHIVLGPRAHAHLRLCSANKFWLSLSVTNIHDVCKSAQTREGVAIMSCSTPSCIHAFCKCPCQFL